MANIFDILKRITVTKDKWENIPEEEQASFNNFMINRFLSMNENYIELVDLIQKNIWQMESKYLYNIYKDIIPKQYVYLKYIKPSKKIDYKQEEIDAVTSYFNVSKKRAKEYISMLPKEELESIKKQICGI